MTQKIKPAYATFEQAKWLKEKGLNDHFYHRQGEDSTRWVSCKYCYDPLDESKTLQLWSDNIESSTKDRLERLISAPEQHQVVEWLRINHGIWVSVNIAMDDKWYFELYNLKDKRNAEIIIEGENVTDFHNSPQEAYSAAFDYLISQNII
jgi:hypothetical protein